MSFCFCLKGTSGSGGNSMGSSSMQSSFSVNSHTHRFLQNQTHYFRSSLPFNIRELVVNIYKSLCRLPVIDRFLRIPDSLWRQPDTFKLDYSDLLRPDGIALPPLEQLRDPQILREHLLHILSIGWTSRIQFEYEYVNMLTLLHNLTDENYTNMSEQQDNSPSLPLPSEEIKERNKCVCLVVKGLSSWLIKSTLTPSSGCSLNSLYEQVSRNKVPAFLCTRLGGQYTNVKRTLHRQYRQNLFTQLNSIPIINNANLLYMLDPTVIDEIDKNHKQVLTNLIASNHLTLEIPTAAPSTSNNIERPHNLSQTTTTTTKVDALQTLLKISTNLSLRDDNLLFSNNIERSMISNLPTNTDTYYNFSQISLEGLLKFLDQWNRNDQTSTTNNNKSIADSLLSYFITSNSSTLTTNETSSSVVDEVSSKTNTALNSLIKVAEFFAEETDLLNKMNLSSGSTTPMNSSVPSSPKQNASNIVNRSFNRNNLDLTSVLRTVLDYYESFFRQPCLQLKLEIFKSMLYLANCIFDSKSQYESLLFKLQNNFDWLTAFINQDNDDQSQLLMPVVNELIDESVLAMAIYAECMCRCCLQTTRKDSSVVSSKDLDRVNRLIENGLKSNSTAIKISTIQGLFYWLETITLGYLGNLNF
jgi:hypothetical protein